MTATLEMVGGPRDGQRVIQAMVLPFHMFTYRANDGRQWKEVYRIRQVPTFTDPVYYEYVGPEAFVEIEDVPSTGRESRE